MNCDEANRVILSENPPYDRETAKHLESCPECRRLEEEWRTIQSMKPAMPHPDPISDALILREAARFAADRTSFRRRMKMFFPVFAATACVCIGAWSLFSRLGPSDGTVDSSEATFATVPPEAVAGFHPEMVLFLENAVEEPVKTMEKATAKTVESHFSATGNLPSSDFQESILELELGMLEVKDSLRQIL
jgi:hypothetical protein